tara:strand:+ start:2707 stop:6564 length:3858 start_codon:yes stop_codon:yes gene_type:complete
MTSIVSDTYTIVLVKYFAYHDIDGSEYELTTQFPTRGDFIRRVLDMAEEIGEKLKLPQYQRRLILLNAGVANPNPDNFNIYVRAYVRVTIEGNTATIELSDSFRAQGGGPYTPKVYYVDDGEELTLQGARERLLRYNIEVDNKLEYHLIDTDQYDDAFEDVEYSSRREFITRVFEVVEEIQGLFDDDDENTNDTIDSDEIEAKLRAVGAYREDFVPKDHTQAMIIVRIEGNTATIDIEDEFFSDPDSYDTILYFVTESGEYMVMREARERLLGEGNLIDSGAFNGDLSGTVFDFNIGASIRIEGMVPSQLPDEVTIRGRTLTRYGNTYTFRTSGLPAETFSFILDELIREIGDINTTRTVDMENRSAVITVVNDPTFPLPRDEEAMLLKDGILYAMIGNVLKLYDIEMREEVLSLKMDKVNVLNSVVAQGEHFAISYKGGFKVYRKFFVDNEYEVDLKYEVKDMGRTYLELKGDTLIAVDLRTLRIYRNDSMSEIDIKNVEVDGVAIGDTGIYTYNENKIIPYYFNGVEGEPIETEGSTVNVEYDKGHLYVSENDPETYKINVSNGSKTEYGEWITYIYDGRIFHIYKNEIELNGKTIFQTQSDIDRIYASGRFICVIEYRPYSVKVIQEFLGTQWVDGDITYTVTEVTGDLITMSDGSEVSLVVNRVDLLKDFKAKVEEGFDWEPKYSDGNAIEANDIVEYKGEKWEVKSSSGKYIEVRKWDKALKLWAENVKFLSRALKYSSGERVLPADTFVKGNEKYLVYVMTMDMALKGEVLAYKNPDTKNVEYYPVKIEGARLESRNSFHYENGKKMEVGDRIKEKLLFRLNPGSTPPAIEAEVISVVRKLPRLNENDFNMGQWPNDPKYSGGEIVYRHPFYPRRSTRPFTANDVVVALNFQGKTERYPGTDDFIEEGDSVSYDGYGDVVSQCNGDECVILAQNEIAIKTNSITLIKRSPIHAVPGIAYSIEDFLNPLLIMPEERILFEDPTEPPEEPDLTEKRFKNVEERIAYIKKEKEEAGCLSLNSTGNRVYPVKFVIGESKGNPVYDIRPDKLLFVFCAETLKEYWIKNRSANGINPLTRNEVKYVVFMTQEEVNEQEEILKTQISSKPVPAQAPVKVSFQDNITKNRIKQMKELIKTTEGKLSGEIPLDKDEDDKETEDIESLKEDLQVYREKLKSYLKQLENPRLRLETYRAQLEELRAEKARVDSLVERYRRGEIQLTEEQEYFLSGQYNSFRSTNRRLNPIYKMEDLIEQLEREIEEQERQKNKRSDSSGGGGKRPRKLKF